MNSPRDFREAAKAIVDEVAKAHKSFQPPGEDQIDKLAEALSRASVRHHLGRAFDTLPTAKQINKEIGQLRRAIRTIKEFTEPKEPGKRIVLDRLAKEMAQMDDDEFSYLGVGERFNAIAALSGPLSRIRLLDSEDAETRNLKGDHRAKHELMAEFLPETYREVFPEAPFGGRKDGDTLEGPGYLFVSLCMKELGYPEVRPETIRKAILRSSQA